MDVGDEIDMGDILEQNIIESDDIYITENLSSLDDKPIRWHPFWVSARKLEACPIGCQCKASLENWY